MECTGAALPLHFFKNKLCHCFNYGNLHYQNKFWFVSQTGLEAGERLFLKLANGYRMEQPPYATNAM